MPTDDPSERDETRESSRLHRLTRRLLDRGEDVRDLANSLLETSDRAKTEMVRMVAREVRNYLDELKLKEDLLHLLRSHSLELKLSVHLKPLVEGAAREATPAPVAAPPAPPESD